MISPPTGGLKEKRVASERKKGKVKRKKIYTAGAKHSYQDIKNNSEESKRMLRPYKDKNSSLVIRRSSFPPKRRQTDILLRRF